MKRFNAVLKVFLLLCVLCNVIMICWAEEKKGIMEGSSVGMSMDTAMNSNYVWRGFTLDGDPVIQQGVSISGYGVTGSIWGNFDIGADDSLASGEFDFTLDYTYETDKFSVSIGNTFYTFPPSNGTSSEFYIGIAPKLAVSSGLTWYHDYVEKGDYLELALGHGLTLGEGPFVLDLSGHIGYNNELFINGNGTDIGIAAGISVPLTEMGSVSAGISYSLPFGGLSDSGDGNQEDTIILGVLVSCEF